MDRSLLRGLRTSALVLPLSVLGLTLAAPAGAQQRMYALDEAGMVSEVVGFGTTSASLVPLGSIQLTGSEITRGLAYDRSTDTLIALMFEIDTARLRRFDPATGQVTPLCSTTSSIPDGLDARFDGTLVFEEALQRLVLVEPDTCSFTRVAAASFLGVHTSDASVAFDQRGLVAALAADGTSQRIDPIDGASSPFAATLFGGARAIEVDTDGTVYYGLFDGSLFWSRPGGQVGQALPGGSSPLNGLALVDPADGLGMSIACDGQPNSTGRGATIEVLGTSAAAENDLELRCRHLPPGTFGIFVTGRTAGTTPVGSGVLCIGQPQVRYTNAVLSSNAAGEVRFPIDLTSLPNGAAVQAGETHLFQYWHRDVPGTSNLSAALSVDFR